MQASRLGAAADPRAALSVVSDCGVYDSSCGYCGGSNWTSHGMQTRTLSVYAYQDLIDQGWRRSGRYLYKPDLSRSCCKPYTIRLDVLQFQPDKGHRRLVRKWRAFLEGNEPLPHAAGGSASEGAGTAAGAGHGAGPARPSGDGSGGSGELEEPSGADPEAGPSNMGADAPPRQLQQQTSGRRRRRGDEGDGGGGGGEGAGGDGAAAAAAAEPPSRRRESHASGHSGGPGDSADGDGAVAAQLQALLAAALAAAVAAGELPQGMAHGPLPVRACSAKQRRALPANVSHTSSAAFALAAAAARACGPPERQGAPQAAGAVGGGGGAVAQAKAAKAGAAGSPPGLNPQHVAKILVQRFNQLVAPPAAHASTAAAGGAAAAAAAEALHSSGWRAEAVAANGHINFLLLRGAEAADDSLRPAAALDDTHQGMGGGAGSSGSGAGTAAGTGCGGAAAGGTGAAPARVAEGASACACHERDASTQAPSGGAAAAAVGSGKAAGAAAKRQRGSAQPAAAPASRTGAAAAAASSSPAAAAATPDAAAVAAAAKAALGVPEGRLQVQLVRAAYDAESYDLYTRYQVAQHGDAADELTPTSYSRFLVDSPLRHVGGPQDAAAPGCGYGSFHMQYRLDGKLVAVGVVDVLPRCLSSVYFFWDTELAALAPGRFSALQEIRWVAAAVPHSPSLRYYYMGYYIHTCGKMRYKAEYRPSDLLCPRRKVWVRITPQVLSAIAQRPYCAIAALPGVQVAPNLAAPPGDPAATLAPVARGAEGAGGGAAGSAAAAQARPQQQTGGAAGGSGGGEGGSEGADDSGSSAGEEEEDEGSSGGSEEGGDGGDWRGGSDRRGALGSSLLMMPGQHGSLGPQPLRVLASFGLLPQAVMGELREALRAWRRVVGWAAPALVYQL